MLKAYCWRDDLNLCTLSTINQQYQIIHQLQIGGTGMKICRCLGLSLLFLSFLSLPIISRAQGQPLRNLADGRSFSIGAAVNMNPFRNEPQYVDTLRREFNMIV